MDHNPRCEEVMPISSRIGGTLLRIEGLRSKQYASPPGPHIRMPLDVHRKNTHGSQDSGVSLETKEVRQMNKHPPKKTTANAAVQTIFQWVWISHCPICLPTKVEKGYSQSTTIIVRCKAFRKIQARCVAPVAYLYQLGNGVFIHGFSVWAGVLNPGEMLKN